MITLITGSPGSGKTLYAIDMCRRLFNERPLFVDQVKDLALDHSLMPPEKEWTAQVEMAKDDEGVTRTRPEYQFPAKSVLLLDECQVHFRPRASGSKIPDIEAALETHRHTGIDLVLITQHPSRISRGVATLVGRHLHIRRTWGLNRAIVYEWDHASSPDRISQATRSIWKYPKDVYKLYKSAEVHTARHQKPPMLLYIVLGLLIAVPVGGYYFFQRIKNKAVPTDQVAKKADKPGEEFQFIPVVNQLQDFTPRIPGDLASAPAYDAVKPTPQMPRISACISGYQDGKYKCNCYTQQMTLIEPSPYDCQARAEGRVYDPYQDPEKTFMAGPPTRAPSANGAGGQAMNVPGDKPI